MGIKICTEHVEWECVDIKKRNQITEIPDVIYASTHILILQGILNNRKLD